MSVCIMLTPPWDGYSNSASLSLITGWTLSMICTCHQSHLTAGSLFTSVTKQWPHFLNEARNLNQLHLPHIVVSLQVDTAVHWWLFSACFTIIVCFGFWLALIVSFPFEFYILYLGMTCSSLFHLFTKHWFILSWHFVVGFYPIIWYYTWIRWSTVVLNWSI